MATDFQARLKRRLARLGGQVKALATMVEKGDWEKMLILAAAVEGATDQVTADLFQGYLESLPGGKAISKDARRMLDVVLKRL